ncbi:MAG: hypothetical protein NTV43_03960 [Methylococcales bacterium]|nr:hypothetical protein [Methylococcales bacterium]
MAGKAQQADTLFSPAITLVYGVALLVGMVAATIAFFAPFFPYGEDSASYIDQARNVMARGVFEKTPFNIWPTDTVSIPDAIFPPGFPLLLVISSFVLQLPVEQLAPYISLAALLLLPLTIVVCFRRVIGLLPALAIGIVVVFTPTAIRHGYIAFTDTLSLVLVIYSVHRLLVAENKFVDWFYLGLLTGFSYLLRNANLGLLLTISLLLFWRVIAEPENRKAHINNGFVWLAGNAVIVVPWLVRNWLQFGKLQPYWMRPSTVSLGDNCHDYLKAQLDTLLALSEVDKFLANNLGGNLLLLSVLLLIIQQVLMTWRHWQKIEQQVFFIAVVYTILGAAIVIAARTKYEWGELIHARYALPYLGFILVALVIVVKNTSATIPIRYWGLGFAIILLVTRAVELPKLYGYKQRDQTIISAAKHLKHNPDVLCSHLDGRFAVSNYAFVYRIVCAAPVRHIYPAFGQNRYFDESLPEWARLGAKHGIVVSLFPDMDDQHNEFPLTASSVQKLQALGWQIERNDKENLIISRQADTTLLSP